MTIIKKKLRVREMRRKERYIYYVFTLFLKEPTNHHMIIFIFLRNYIEIMIYRRFKNISNNFSLKFFLLCSCFLSFLSFSVFLSRSTICVFFIYLKSFDLACVFSSQQQQRVIARTNIQIQTFNHPQVVVILSFSCSIFSLICVCIYISRH